MTEQARRPILKLKSAPPVRESPASAPAASSDRWKCKPCGGVVIITGDEPADQDIRCPACNARLGLAGDFHADGKVRARRLPPLRAGA